MSQQKQVRGKCTLEFKMEAVRLVERGQSIAVRAKIFGILKASLNNWVVDADRVLTRCSAVRVLYLPR